MLSHLEKVLMVREEIYASAHRNLDEEKTIKALTKIYFQKHST